MVEKRCSTCGYLGVWHASTGELIEADNHFRETGIIPPLGGDPTRRAYREMPVCSTNAVDFRRSSEIDGEPDAEKRKTVFNKARSCDRHSPWKIGFTPKQHMEFSAVEAAERRAEKADARGFVSICIAVVAIILNAVAVTLSFFKSSPAPVHNISTPAVNVYPQITVQPAPVQLAAPTPPPPLQRNDRPATE